MPACPTCGHDPAPAPARPTGAAAGLAEARRRFGAAAVPDAPKTAEERAKDRLRRMGLAPNDAA